MRCSLRRLLCAAGLLASASILFLLYLDPLSEGEEENDYLTQDDLNLPGFAASPNFTSPRPKIFLPPEDPTDLPVIVWWTPFTPSQRDIRKCPEGSCLFTHSRTELANPNVNVSAFVWYGTEFDLHDLPLPRRHPHHLWALMHEESPKNNWLLATEKGISLFNVTSTFSRYSDYPLHLQYLHTMRRLLQPVRTPTELKSKDGRALVLFMQSACNPPSDRDSYVRELMKHISVDCPGKCLHNRDDLLPAHLVDPLTFGTEEVLEIVGKYKFVLSFENARCHDYLTEKFWRPLYAGSVPVVQGSPSIRDWDPSSEHPSFIVAEDFQSPEMLAHFLLELDKNDTEYNEYLKFKQIGVTNKRLLEHFNARQWTVDGEGQGGNSIEGFECFLCDKLHQRRSKGLSEHNIVANSSHYDCLLPQPSVRRESQSVKERLREMEPESRTDLDFWIWTSKCAKERGVVASRLIGRGAGQEELDAALSTACDNIHVH